MILIVADMDSGENGFKVTENLLICLKVKGIVNKQNDPNLEPFHLHSKPGKFIVPVFRIDFELIAFV